MKNILPLLSIFILISCKKNLNSNLIYEGEKHFKNVKQITFGGDNAEAYWSFMIKIWFFSQIIMSGELNVIRCF